MSRTDWIEVERFDVGVSGVPYRFALAYLQPYLAHPVVFRVEPLGAHHIAVFRREESPQTEQAA